MEMTIATFVLVAVVVAVFVVMMVAVVMAAVVMTLMLILMVLVLTAVIILQIGNWSDYEKEKGKTLLLTSRQQRFELLSATGQTWITDFSTDIWEEHMTRYSVEYSEMEEEGKAMEKAMASVVMAAGGSWRHRQWETNRWTTESGFWQSHPVQRMQLIQPKQISPARRITLSQHTPDKEVPRPWKTKKN